MPRAPTFDQCDAFPVHYEYAEKGKDAFFVIKTLEAWPPQGARPVEVRGY